MAYIEVFPKSVEAQQHLSNDRDAWMNILHQATKDSLNVPDHDIIVELNQCTSVGFNWKAVQAGAAPDVVVKIWTSDHDLSPRFQTLADQVVISWNTHFGKALKLELWINTIDTWSCNIDFS